MNKQKNTCCKFLLLMVEVTSLNIWESSGDGIMSHRIHEIHANVGKSPGRAVPAIGTVDQHGGPLPRQQPHQLRRPLQQPLRVGQPVRGAEVRQPPLHVGALLPRRDQPPQLPRQGRPPPCPPSLPLWAWLVLIRVPTRVFF